MPNNSRRSKRRVREWTEFEMHTLLSLICKGVHRISFSKDKNTTLLKLTEKLNHAVNRPRGEDDWHENDMEVDDVMYMMQQVTREKKATMLLIERQVPSRITRQKTRAFARNLGFTGSVVEWESGRDVEEKARQAAQYQDFCDRVKEKEANQMLRLDSDEPAEPKKSSHSRRRPTLCPRAKDDAPPVSQDSGHTVQTIEDHDMVDSSPISASNDCSETCDGPSTTGWSGGFAQLLAGATAIPSTPTGPNWGDGFAPNQASPLWQPGTPSWQGEQERYFGETDVTAQVDPYATGQDLHGEGIVSTSQGHPDTALRGAASPARDAMWGDVGGRQDADDRFQRSYDTPALSLPCSSGWGLGFDNFAAGTPLPNILGLDENDSVLSQLQDQCAARQPYSFSAQTPLACGSGGHGVSTASDLPHHGSGSASAANGQENLDPNGGPFVHPDRRLAGQN